MQYNTIQYNNHVIEVTVSVRNRHTHSNAPAPGQFWGCEYNKISNKVRRIADVVR